MPPEAEKLKYLFSGYSPDLLSSEYMLFFWGNGCPWSCSSSCLWLCGMHEEGGGGHSSMTVCVKWHVGGGKKPTERAGKVSSVGKTSAEGQCGGRTRLHSGQLLHTV